MIRVIDFAEGKPEIQRQGGDNEESKSAFSRFTV